MNVEQVSQKECVLSFGDSTVHLILITSSITNKYKLITDSIKSMSEYFGPDFDKWLGDFLVLYHNCKEEDKYDIVFNNIPQIKDYVDRYFDERNTDFSKFVDETKVKKSSILFTKDDIELIAKSSTYLKIYSLISNTENKLDTRLHKKIYNILIDELTKKEVVTKIFSVVKTKTFRYSLTDRYMWEYIRAVYCKTIDTYVTEIFNFIMNNIIILCEEDKNPITYFVSVVEESVKWFLKSVYKETIVYDDTISTEDIHTSDVDNLKSYMYNDTLGRLKSIAYEKAYNVIEMEGKSFEEDFTLIEFQSRVFEVQHVSPIAECVVYPILAKITSIPFVHFRTLSPADSIILSTYVQSMMREVFVGEYQEMINLLNYYPMSQPSMATTYKIKNVKKYLDMFKTEAGNFYGFTAKMLPYKMIGFFVGRISRTELCDIYTGKKLVGVPLSKIEKEMLSYFLYYFSGKMEDKIEKMKLIMKHHF